jgi:dipeptidyl aminopeptidase/acylaminoacyl peptidase
MRSAILFSLTSLVTGFMTPHGALSSIRGGRTAFATTAPVAEPVTTTTSEEIIPKEVLFGNPTFASPSLSPDGKYLAYLAPDDKDILNVHVRTVDDAETARVVTFDKSRGIRSFLWAEDSITVLYLQDYEGDENFHVFAVDATTVDAAKDLTPGEKVKASSVMPNKRYPDELLISTNARNEKNFDMYKCDYKTGELTMVAENPGDVVGWGVEDESNEVRFALVRNQEDSSNTLRVRDSADSEWRELITFPYGEEGSFVEFCKDGGKSCYITSSIGRETKALLKVDLQTGETIEEICSNDKCDVGGVALDKDTKEVRLVSFNYARLERVFFDEDLKKDYRVLEEKGPEGAEVRVTSKTRDETTWVVAYTRSDGPTEYKLYDQVAKKLADLYVSRPELLNYKFALMEDVRITARDGLELVGYLTRAKDNGEKTPLILLVHGGPWARDTYGFNAQAQWFANRGYSTLQVNFRGSTGYGKSFLHKGDGRSKIKRRKEVLFLFFFWWCRFCYNIFLDLDSHIPCAMVCPLTFNLSHIGQWGVGSMQHDLTDAVEWAIKEGIADPDKICIYGGSYGGYACLAGLAFTPDLYRCGVDIVGPSNVKTLLDSIPAYWGPLRNQMLIKIGDVDSDEEFNKKISPLYHVDNIKAPLLIGQGKNDPRVKQAEADQIALSMQSKGIPVEYVLYPDEGHGFARPDNRIDFNGRVELFLKEHLGGRAEEFVKPEGSTAEFPLLEEESSS